MKTDDATMDYEPQQSGSGSRLCPACGKRSAATTCPEDGTTTVELKEAVSTDRYIGRVIDGRFRIDRTIGQGGMGRVYLATQLSLGQRVAVKVILPERESGEIAVQRFHREAKATTRLTSPHVVRVYDFGVDAETSAPYLVMEYLEGKTLAALLRSEGALRPRRAAAIAAQVARALVEAEARSIVHRDIKPDNIFLVANADQPDFVKVMDFGVARSVAGTPDSLASVTHGGNIVGTPAYMSPEQITGKPVDTRSDLYAVGCLIHEMLVGTQPYSNSEEGMARMVAHITLPPPELPPNTPDGEPIPEALRALHRGLLQKAASDRPATAAATVEVLMGIAESRSANSSVERLALAMTGTAEGPLLASPPKPTVTMDTTPPRPSRWARVLAGLGALTAAGAGLAAYLRTPEPPAAAPAPVVVQAPVAPPAAPAEAAEAPVAPANPVVAAAPHEPPAAAVVPTPAGEASPLIAARSAQDEDRAFSRREFEAALPAVAAVEKPADARPVARPRQAPRASEPVAPKVPPKEPVDPKPPPKEPTAPAENPW